MIKLLALRKNKNCHETIKKLKYIETSMDERERQLREELALYHREDPTNPNTLFAEFWPTLQAYGKNPKEATIRNLRSGWNTLNDAKTEMAFSSSYAPDVVIRSIDHDVQGLIPSAAMQAHPSHFYAPVSVEGNMFTSADVAALMSKIRDVHGHLYSEGKLVSSYVDGALPVKGIIPEPYAGKLVDDAGKPTPPRNWQFRVSNLLPSTQKTKLVQAMPTVLLDVNHNQVETTDKASRSANVLYPGGVRLVGLTSIATNKMIQDKICPDHSDYKSLQSMIMSSVNSGHNLIQYKIQSSSLVPPHSVTQVVAENQGFDAALGAMENKIKETGADQFKLANGKMSVGYDWKAIAKKAKAKLVGACAESELGSDALTNAKFTAEVGQLAEVHAGIIGTEIPIDCIVEKGPQMNLVANCGKEKYLLSMQMENPEKSVPNIQVTKITGDSHACNDLVCATNGKQRISYHLTQ